MTGTTYTIDIHGINIDVKIAASSGYNIRMSFRDGKGRISIPRGTPAKSIDEAIISMNKWLNELARKKPHLFLKNDSGALTQPTIELLGRSYQLVIQSNHTTGTIRGKRKDGVLLIEVPPGIIHDTKAHQEYIPKLLSRMFAKEIEQRVDDINRSTINGNIGKVTLRSVSSRWGSCTAVNDIMLSNRLLLAPVEILDHVIIHELAHIVHKDHSMRFWRLVAQHDKNMKGNHHWLKVHGGKLQF